MFKTGMITHKDLNVWKDSMDLFEEIYLITKQFPREEIYGLTNQIRRAAVSIPVNISEGCARNYSGDYIRFLGISRGSLSELETLILLSSRIQYMDDVSLKLILIKIRKINVQLSHLIKSIEKRKSSYGQ